MVMVVAKPSAFGVGSSGGGKPAFHLPPGVSPFSKEGVKFLKRQRRRGRGGGRGTSSAEKRRIEEAASKLRAEIQQRKIQEQIKQQEFRVEQEGIRQEKIFKGTIAGQITGGKPSQIGLPGTPFEQALRIGTGVPKPPRRFDLEFFRKDVVAPIFLAGKQGETILTSLRNVGSLIMTKARKGEEIKFKAPEFGTKSDQPLPFGAGGGEVITQFDILRGEAIADPTLLIPPGAQVISGGEKIQKSLVAELQLQVTSGALTLKEAEKEFETKFEKRFKEEIIPSIERRERFTRKVEKAERPVFEGGTAAELVGIVALSITPVGAAIGGTAFVAEGVPKLVGGETLLEKGLGAAEIGFGFVGGGLAVKQAERLADISLVRELQSQRGFITGKEAFKTPEGSVFDITSLRAFGKEATLKTETITPVFKTGKDTFSMTGGRGRTTLDIFSVEKGARVKQVEEFAFGGRQTIAKEIPKIISKDLGVKIGLEEFTGTTGIGFIKKRGKETFQEFRFGGISKDIETELGKITQVQAGELSGIILKGVGKPKGLDLFLDRGISFKVRQEVVGKFPIEEAGIIKRISAVEEEGIGFVIPSGVKKTPFQTTFQKLETPAPVGISKQIEKQIFKQAPITTKGLGFSLIGIPRAVGGAGLTEQQFRQARGGLVQTDIQQVDFLPPTKNGLIQKDLFILGTKEVPFVGGGISTITREKAVQKGLQLQVPRVALIERQATKQLAKQLQLQEQIFPPLTPGRPPSFKPIKGFDFGFGVPFAFPSFLGGQEIRGRRKRRAKARVPIRPSFTGIILDLQIGIPETTQIGGVDLGILPGRIRGVPKIKVTKKKKVKKKKKESKKK